jgi:hypothetical protein
MWIKRLSPTKLEIGREGNIFFYSYDTLVSVLTSEDIFRTSQNYSTSTSRALNQYLSGYDRILERTPEELKYLARG